MQPDDPQTPKRRPRAKTGSSFPNLLKARRSEPSPAAPSPASTNDAPASSMSLESLITALTPPAVLSLAHARALVMVFHTETPPLKLLAPVLSRLCAPQVPTPFLISGMEIISAYGGSRMRPLDDINRSSLFALLRSSDPKWTPDTWELRLKCLTKLTANGANIGGAEKAFLDYVKACVSSAFTGLLSEDDYDRSREAFLEKVCDLMREALMKNVSSYKEQDMYDVLVFFEDFLERSLDSVPAVVTSEASSIPSSPGVSAAGNSTIGNTHRRNPSSVSGPIFYPGSRPQPPQPSPREPMSPLDRTHLPISLYFPILNMYRSQMVSAHIGAIVSLLLRIVAVHLTPLPRLHVGPTPQHQPRPAEENALKQLFALLSGPYADTVAGHIKRLMSSIHPQEAVGAFRTVRAILRDAAEARMGLLALRRGDYDADAYAPSGQPVTSDAHAGALYRAYKENLEVPSLTLERLISAVGKAVRQWAVRSDAEKLLEEALGMVKDVMAEARDRKEGEGRDRKEEEVRDRKEGKADVEDVNDYSSMRNDEGRFVGTILREAVKYVQRMRLGKGTFPFDKTLAIKIPFLPIEKPSTAPTPLLLTLCTQLSLPLSTPMTPSLSSILLSVTSHLTDAQTATIPITMHKLHLLTPTSMTWLDSISELFTQLVLRERPASTYQVFTVAGTIHSDLIGVPSYRRKLGRRICELMEQALDNEEMSDGAGMDGDDSWARLCANEFVCRIQECRKQEGDENEQFVEEDGEDIASRIICMFERHIYGKCPCTSTDLDDIATFPHPPSSQDATLPSTPGMSAPSSNSSTAALSRVVPEVTDVPQPQQLSSSSILPLVASMLPSWSISHSREPEVPSSPVVAMQPEAEIPVRNGCCCRPVSAAVALVNAFQDLSFVGAPQLVECIRLFKVILSVLEKAKCPKARLVILQLLMRLRADRDHRLYILGNLDKDIDTLAVLVDRSRLTSRETPFEDGELQRARSTSRGMRRGRARSSATSRSRSRAATAAFATPTRPKPKEPLWMVPEVVPFDIPISQPSSDGIATYEAYAPTEWEELKHWLPVSDYVHILVEILRSEMDWEILSYVLCHLPVQLANKHFFCGPKTKSAIVSLLVTLCTTTFQGALASVVAEQLPESLRLRDAQGLIFHTLAVLISYRGIFEDKKQHDLLVDCFMSGLNGQPSTVKFCLNALSICAYELPKSITKNLSQILEKLSRIMTNADMAVHILDFVSIVGSLPALYVNFREQEFKTVFAVAVTYIHYHNSPDTRGLSGRESFALSQHVLVMSYYIIYVWFLALPLQDRPNHVTFLARRLLLASEAKGAIDEPTEVCFDWLARYTYATADPKPAYSLLGEVVMNPPRRGGGEPVDEPSEPKVWLLGNSFVSIRTLPRRGWIQVESVRPSGETKFLCKLENFPQVNPGDVDPDKLSDLAIMMSNRNPKLMEQDVPDPEADQARNATNEQSVQNVRDIFVPGVERRDLGKAPDPVTGFVWSKSAPSQRRKDVSIDPSFFALQLSQYPYLPKPSSRSRLVPYKDVKGLLSTLKHTPVIDMHKIAILYVAPGQDKEQEILGNIHGSPAYTRFLEGIARLIRVRDQQDVYTGDIIPETDGEYAYAWWDDIVQIVYHVATLMPNLPEDKRFVYKKRHIGNDKVRIVWNDSGMPYQHDTISSDFNFVNFIIEPHSIGTIAAFSNSKHEHEFFKVTTQRMAGMPAFGFLGEYALVSAESLPHLLRYASISADFFSEVYQATDKDTTKEEYITNWRRRLQYIRTFRTGMESQHPLQDPTVDTQSSAGLQDMRDFTRYF